MKKTNSLRNGLLFGFTAFLAIGGPILINHAGEQSYPVPEAAALTVEDQKFVDDQTREFCGPGPAKTAEPVWPEPPPSQEVPVVLYHRITRADKPSHEVTRPALFREEMDWLKAEGYETISVSQLSDYMVGKGTIPKKPVVITFDDGWKDNIDAAKYLKKLDMGATFYIISGFFTAPQYMDVEEVESLAKNQKFEIGSHSHSHFVKHKKMSEVDLCTFAKELSASKLILERVVEKPITSFAWPYGFTTKESVYAANAIGYKTTLHVNTDSNNSAGHSPLFIRRMNIDGNCKLEDFQQMIKTSVLKECSPNTSPP
jgi:peptidoglycan/xylan/chitin deacetylase (PgdA/CDA1 family)